MDFEDYGKYIFKIQDPTEGYLRLNKTSYLVDPGTLDAATSNPASKLEHGGGGTKAYDVVHSTTITNTQQIPFAGTLTETIGDGNMLVFGSHAANGGATDSAYGYGKTYWLEINGSVCATANAYNDNDYDFYINTGASGKIYGTFDIDTIAGVKTAKSFTLRFEGVSLREIKLWYVCDTYSTQETNHVVSNLPYSSVGVLATDTDELTAKGTVTRTVSTYGFRGGDVSCSQDLKTATFHAVVEGGGENYIKFIEDPQAGDAGTQCYYKRASSLTEDGPMSSDIRIVCGGVQYNESFLGQWTYTSLLNSSSPPARSPVFMKELESLGLTTDPFLLFSFDDPNNDNYDNDIFMVVTKEMMNKAQDSFQKRRNPDRGDFPFGLPSFARDLGPLQDIKTGDPGEWEVYFFNVEGKQFDVYFDKELRRIRNPMIPKTTLLWETERESAQEPLQIADQNALNVDTDITLYGSMLSNGDIEWETRLYNASNPDYYSDFGMGRYYNALFSVDPRYPYALFGTVSTTSPISFKTRDTGKIIDQFGFTGHAFVESEGTHIQGITQTLDNSGDWIVPYTNEAPARVREERKLTGIGEESSVLYNTCLMYTKTWEDILSNGKLFFQTPYTDNIEGIEELQIWSGWLNTPVMRFKTNQESVSLPIVSKSLETQSDSTGSNQELNYVVEFKSDSDTIQNISFVDTFSPEIRTKGGTRISKEVWDKYCSLDSVKIILDENTHSLDLSSMEEKEGKYSLCEKFSVSGQTRDKSQMGKYVSGTTALKVLLTGTEKEHSAGMSLLNWRMDVGGLTNYVSEDGILKVEYKIKVDLQKIKEDIANGTFSSELPSDAALDSLVYRYNNSVSYSYNADIYNYTDFLKERAEATVASSLYILAISPEVDRKQTSTDEISNKSMKVEVNNYIGLSDTRHIYLTDGLIGAYEKLPDGSIYQYTAEDMADLYNHLTVTNLKISKYDPFSDVSEPVNLLTEAGYSITDLDQSDIVNIKASLANAEEFDEMSPINQFYAKDIISPGTLKNSFIRVTYDINLDDDYRNTFTYKGGKIFLTNYATLSESLDAGGQGQAGTNSLNRGLLRSVSPVENSLAGAYAKESSIELLKNGETDKTASYSKDANGMEVIDYKLLISTGSVGKETSFAYSGVDVMNVAPLINGEKITDHERLNALCSLFQTYSEVAFLETGDYANFSVYPVHSMNLTDSDEEEYRTLNLYNVSSDHIELEEQYQLEYRVIFDAEQIRRGAIEEGIIQNTDELKFSLKNTISDNNGNAKAELYSESIQATGRISKTGEVSEDGLTTTWTVQVDFMNSPVNNVSFTDALYAGAGADEGAASENDRIAKEASRITSFKILTSDDTLLFETDSSGATSLPDTNCFTDSLLNISGHDYSISFGTVMPCSLKFVYQTHLNDAQFASSGGDWDTPYHLKNVVEGNLELVRADAAATVSFSGHGSATVSKSCVDSDDLKNAQQRFSINVTTDTQSSKDFTITDTLTNQCYSNTLQESVAGSYVITEMTITYDGTVLFDSKNGIDTMEESGVSFSNGFALSEEQTGPFSVIFALAEGNKEISISYVAEGINSPDADEEGAVHVENLVEVHRDGFGGVPSESVSYDYSAQKTLKKTGGLTAVGGNYFDEDENPYIAYTIDCNLSELFSKSELSEYEDVKIVDVIPIGLDYIPDSITVLDKATNEYITGSCAVTEEGKVITVSVPNPSDHRDVSVVIKTRVNGSNSNAENTAYIELGSQKIAETNSSSVETILSGMEYGTIRSRTILSDLYISKEVSGNIGNRSKLFDFNISLSRNDEPYTGDIEYTGTRTGTLHFTDGSAQIKLGHNDSICLHDIPYGTEYSVDEAVYLSYSPEKTNDTGMITEEDALVSFVNERNVVVPTGIAVGTALPCVYAVFGGAPALSIVSQIKKRREL